QVQPVSDIADRMDIVDARARILIDFHRIMRSQLDADLFEIKAQDIGDAAGGVHDLAGAEDSIVIAGDAHAGSRALDLGDIAAQTEFDPLLLHLGGQMIAQIVIEAAQDLLAAIDQYGLDAKVVEDAGELDRDITAPHDADALRQLLQVESLVRGDGELPPR